MAKKKSKTFLEDGVQRLVLASVAGGKIIGEAFTKCFDTYKEKHEASEKKEKGGWSGDFLKNSAKSMEELLRHLSKAPKEMVDTYLEEEDEEDEATKEEPQKEEKETAKEEEAKEETAKEEKDENRKSPVKARGKASAKAASSKKSKS